MRFTDGDKHAVAVLRQFAQDFLEPGGLHGPIYYLGQDTRLYVLGIVKDASRAGYPERQVLILGSDPLPKEKFPDIPQGCELRLCTFAVLKRPPTPEEREADKREGSGGEDGFTYELLEFKGWSDHTVFFAGTTIRSRSAGFL
ncbi:MAG: hypothetical protein Q7R85_00225 [bacterium]|nr:hypothetical protein [bacterium]